MHVKHKPAARILVLLLAITTVLAFTPAIAWTQDVQAAAATGVAVNGLNVTTHEYWVWDGSSYTTAKASSDNYNIHYTSGSLELKDDDNFTSVATTGGDIAIKLNKAKINAGNGTAISVTDGTLTLTLENKNTITTTTTESETDEYYGIAASSDSENPPECNVNISGTGRLSISSNFNALAAAGNVTIQSGTITASSTQSYAILADKTVSISGGNTTAEAAGNVAIEGDSIAISGGTVIAKGSGKDGMAMANGLMGTGISITSGAVYAYGGGRAMNTSGKVLVSSADIAKTAKENNYLTILSDPSGKATLAYASASAPAGKLSIGDFNTGINQEGVDLTANAYGDYSNAEGHAHSWAVQKTTSGYDLDLNNAYITSGKVDCRDGDLSVTLSGANTVDLTGLPSGEETYGLYCGQSISFTGSGSLGVYANVGTTFSRGIFAKDGKIVLSGTPEITGCGGSGPESVGIDAKTMIVVNGGILTGVGGDVSSTEKNTASAGIVAATGIDASGGTVEGIGGTAKTTGTSKTSISIGIAAESESQTVFKGNITAGGGDADASYGFFAEGLPIAINGAGTVTAKSMKQTAWNIAPSIDSSLNAVVKTGSRLDGTDAAIVELPTDETYAGSTYVQITTTAKAAPVPPTYDITSRGLIGCELTYNSKPENGKDFIGKITHLPGYALPKNITITVGGQQLTDDQFSYDPLTGEFTIPGKYVNGAVSISGTGMKMNLRARRMVESRLNLLVTTPSSKQGTGTSAKTADGVKKAAADTYGTVTVIKPIKKTYKSMSIPNTVTAYSYVYKVTAVSAKAFKNNTKLKSLTLGKNVKTVGAKACYNCQKLKSVKFAGKNITAISKGAFRTCAKNCRFMIPKAKYSKYVKMLKKSGVPEGAQYIKY